MAKSQLNLTALQTAFEQRPERVFSQADLAAIFTSRPFEWKLPRSMNPQTFIQMLLRRTEMRRVSLASTEYSPLLRYVWGKNVAPVLVALSAKPKAFCSHGSAMWIHRLGGDERHIFVNSEQSEKPPNHGVLTQEGIDRAFRNEQRRSRLVYSYERATIVVLNGKNSGRLEVESAKTPSGEQVEVTSLERTLVDITVRPAYAGGVSNVLVSFGRARPRASAKKILHILKTLDYKYPFHQAIGFYMKRSGYSKADQDLVRELGTEFNFYLGHGIKKPQFDEEFKVYFPEALGSASGS